MKKLGTVLAICGLLAAGCGSDGEQAETTTAIEDSATTASVDTSATAETTASADTAATTGDSTVATTAGSAPAVDDSEFDLDATLRFSYSVGPSSFDPSKASSSFDNVALFITYDRLVHMSPEGEALPGLATAWEFSEDGSTLTLTLREGVTFHDGSPLTAEVVKANLLRNQAGVSKGDLAAIVSIDAVDPLTVRLNLGAPGGALPLILSDRAGVMASEAGIADPGLDLQPVGAGMYKVVEYQKDAKIVYERYEDYWDPSAAKAKRIEFTIIQDNVAAFNAVKSDAIDATVLVPSQVAEAEDAGFDVVAGLTLGFYHVQFNRSKPFLDDPEVRKALVMATDREALVEGIALGKGETANQIFPEGYWAAVAELNDPSFLPYDPETATQMLRDAGVPDGQTYEVIVPTTGVYPALAEAVKDMWSEVGINLEIRPVDSVQTAPIFYVQSDGDMLVSVFGGRADPAQTLGLLFTAGPIQNPGGHSTPEITEAVSAASEPGSLEERQPAVQAATQLVAENAMDVLLYFPETQYGLKDNVLGFQIWLSSKPELRGVGIAAG